MPLTLRRQLGRYDHDQLWTLILAAGASPGVRHRWASVSHLTNAALRITTRGHRSARAADLPGLLDACHRDEPRLSMLEDFLPKDPREEVLTRLDGRLVRLFPGSIERPVADVSRALLVSGAADDAILARNGFGIRHLVAATLRYADWAIGAMAASWPAGDIDGTGPPQLTAAELAAAGIVFAAGTPAELGLSADEERALAWATTCVDRLPYQPDHPQSPFGRYLRVTTADTDAPARWLPLCHVPEILGYGVASLASEVSSDPGVRRRFAKAAAAETRRALGLFSPTILGPPDADGGPLVSPGNYVQWIARLGEGRAVLVQVVSDITITSLPFNGPPAAVQVVERAAAAPGQPHRVPMPGGVITLDAGTEVVPLLVVASAGHIVVPQMPGLPAMSLDDLRWATISATSDSDLFMFCRDLARSDRPNLLGWEAIDIWEWWRSNKTMFAGGRPPDLMSVAAHAGDREWERARRLAPVERALLALDLPALADIDGIDHEDAGPPVVYQWTADDPAEGGTPPQRGHHPRGDLLGWALHVAPAPVAIVASHPAWPWDDHRVLHDLAGAFAFGFGQIDPAWRRGHNESTIVGYVLDLRSTTRDGAPAMQVVDLTLAAEPLGNLCRATIAVSLDALARDVAQDTQAARDAMGEAVRALVAGAGLPAEHVAAVSDAWAAAPPTFAMSLQRTPTVRNDQPAPIDLDEALTAQMDRLVAEAVHAAGIQPGQFRGDEAKTLDRDVLAPAALQLLTDRLQQFDMDEIVMVGMRELERAVASRRRQIVNLEQAARVLDVAWDPAERLAAIQREHLTLRRCGEVAIEAALRSQPTGTRRVDRVGWGEILAAAQAYLSATTRSEHVHHQVRPSAIEISTSYEITVVPDPAPSPSTTGAGAGIVYDLDFDALSRNRATHELTDLAGEADGADDADPKPEAAPADEHGPTGQPPSVIDADLDAAMYNAGATSGSDLLVTLFALAHWPLTEDDDDVVAVPVDAIVDHVLDFTILGDVADGRSRVERAVADLTSTASDLQAADWKPWHARTRRHRLLIQPLPTLSDGHRVVAPHYCLGALTAYRRHLTQGQLPWTQPPPAGAIAKALAVIRDRRNHELEKTVAQRLRALGWQVMENVKETSPERLNVTSLHGEIDAVAGRASSRTVWLLEVKDPADTFVVPEIRRHLDKFFADRGSDLSYSTHLKLKHDDLAPHANAVAAALGLPPRSDSYEIRAVFVTRTPVPAAYVSGPFPFTTLQALPSWLDQS